MKKLPTWIEVDLDRLIQNLDALRARLRPEVKVLLTVKADAYGLGAVQVAEASTGHVDVFGVATVDEALELREAGIKGAILILSPVLETEIPLVINGGFALTISSLDFAQVVAVCAVQAETTVDVHIEVDTGMGRTGVALQEAQHEITGIAALPGLSLRGVYTHFPVSDSDPDYTREQISLFNHLIAALRTDDVSIPLVHSANSAAVVAVDESHMDMVRPGLLAYGHVPAGSARAPEFHPIMSWKTRIVRVRKVPVGKSISYGREFMTTRDSVIGVVPVGYGHGYPYALSNRGRMIVNGIQVPIVGRVTMDMTMVDLTDLPSVPKSGDEVVLFGTQSGPQGETTITIHDVAEWAGTIGYEIICGLSRRVPRTYFRQGKVETYKSLLGVLPNHVAV